MVTEAKEAIVYSALTGSFTFLGAILLLCFSLTKRIIAFSLGLSAGVMLIVSYFALLPPAFVYGGAFHLSVGMGAAVLFMLLLRQIPFSKVGSKEESSRFDRLAFFLAIAVALHNAPEGAAMGIGYRMDPDMGHILAIAMAIHNIPEGIGLAAPLIAARRHPLVIGIVGLLCGAALPAGAWLGIRYLTGSPDILSAGLVFAASTMIWVVVCEICPRAFGLDKIMACIGTGTGILLMYIIHLFH
ncbi:ZIP family metal transporter [Lihuaxuella thermophila]|uniref:Zinc transporter, ZIP family n=1 Tax=Lihuaxuella thermophila TaxID=1173111 RepID=A0A1H8BB55_9BACL|nr:ZIP family metal transporter [Lihuaxuella thermophila]SEM80191.1 zinc transporter, ZIP family [Lihuaxuella thermophila]